MQESHGSGSAGKDHSGVILQISVDLRRVLTAAGAALTARLRGTF